MQSNLPIAEVNSNGFGIEKRGETFLERFKLPKGRNDIMDLGLFHRCINHCPLLSTNAKCIGTNSM